TCARSTPFSLASFRTSGDRICDRGPRSAGGGATACAEAATGAAAGCGAGAAAGGAGAEGASAPPGVADEVSAPPEPDEASCAAAPGAPAPPAPPSAISASSVPTATVSPSATMILASTPAADDGTSVSTLSVEISNS